MDTVLSAMQGTMVLIVICNVVVYLQMVFVVEQMEVARAAQGQIFGDLIVIKRAIVFHQWCVTME